VLDERLRHASQGAASGSSSHCQIDGYQGRLRRVTRTPTEAVARGAADLRAGDPLELARRALLAPPRSPAIVGSAVDTIVWSRDAISSTSISAPMTSRSRGAAVAAVCAGGRLSSCAEVAVAVSFRPA
jgi:hypothetical protein